MHQTKIYINYLSSKSKRKKKKVKKKKKNVLNL
jgi:hypothetical protein